MFTLNTESMTWHQAKEWCESRRSELLKLPTDTILDLFNSQLAASTFVDDNGVPITQVFIGLSDLGEEGNFRYTDNGYASVEYWAPNQPDNYGGNEHCVAINALDPELRWEDVSCDETHAFACLNSLISLLWFPYDGKIYKYRQAFSTWHGAVEECREDAGHLIQISSQVMVDLSNQLALHDNVDANRAIWIDANDIDSEGNWQYADGTPLTYTNWNTGEPNNGLANVIEEDCAVMLPE
ncbi:macrophage mannose receptor 1-like [Saccoglossus kowalevskii]